MASFKNFVLLILLIMAVNLVADAAHKRRATPSKKQKRDLERQLKAINKPAIKSFKTKHGDIFDCIDIHKQLAFDHHLLKNHSVQLKPTIEPEWITGNNISHKLSPLQEGISCPDGTVIVKRTTMQHLINDERLKSMRLHGPGHFLTQGNNTSPDGTYFATINYGPSSFTGIKAKINVWDPQVFPDQVSVAMMGVGGGPSAQFFTIFVGWMVNPALYQSDHVHLYAFWSTHGSKTGCYDTRCPGFVQVSRSISFGVLLQPVSVYGGPQYEIDLSLYQDRAKGDWWISYAGENIGYWPASLFLNSGSDNRAWGGEANYATWGGQTSTPVREVTPVMGSGHWPREGFKKAAYVNAINIIDPKGKAFDPEFGTINVRMTDNNCYRAIYYHDDEYPWKAAVTFGGPAGCKG